MMKILLCMEYLMIKSKGKISDSERNVRLLISSFPEAFNFSFLLFTRDVAKLVSSFNNVNLATKLKA